MQEPSAATSSSIHDEPSTPEGASATPGPSSTTFNLNHTPSESSFLPAQAAVSSTPAARAQAAAAANNSTFFTSQTSGADPSWSALVESPLVRLDRELREFTRADPEPTSTTITTDVLSTPRAPHTSLRASNHANRPRATKSRTTKTKRRYQLTCLHP
jgi:DASH complex subunit ASK1